MEATTPTPKHNWFIFVIFLAIVLLLTCITSSCGVLKTHYLQKYCKTKDSISEHTEVIYKDTTIYISGYKDSIIINNPCDTVIHITRNTGGVKMGVNTVNGKLKFTCEADSLKAVIKTLQERKYKYQLRTIEKKVNELTKWQSFFIVCGYVLIIILIILAAIKVLKYYFKPF